MTNDPVDWAHTDAAVEARNSKAKTIARWLAGQRVSIAAATGMTRDERRQVEKQAGLPRAASDETWNRAITLLSASYALRAAPPATPVTTGDGCRNGCDRPARLYPSGRFCDACSPWAVAGRPDPAALVDPARTAAGLRQRH